MKAGKSLVAICTVAIASLVMAASASASGKAAVVTVNSDAPALTPPNCSLRDAIQAVTDDVNTGGCVITSPGGDDHVSFAPSMSGQTISLNFGALHIDDADAIEIAGPGMNQLTVTAHDASRVFDAQTTTTITGMSLVHGRAPVTGDAAQGGAIESTASGTFSLVLTDVKVADSTATANASSSGPAEFADGGAIHALGALTLDQSVVTGNAAFATQTGGLTKGAEARGGAIFGQDDITITNSTISDNQATATTNGTGQAAATAGIRSDGLLGLSGSTMSGNDATATALTGTANARGAIYQNATSGQAGIEQSTIADNTADATGSIVGDQVGGLNLHNETVIRGSTIALNGPTSLSADVDGANINSAVPSSEVEDTIIADPRGTGQNCTGILTSNGFNDDTTGAGGSCFDTPQLTDLTSNPLLAVAGLAPNGGLTQTIALQPTSPMIDAGSNADLDDPNQDQRGVAFLRPVDFSGLPNAANGTDIGAFEVQQGCTGFTQPTPSTACPSPPGPTPTTPTAPPTKKKKCKKAKKGASSAKKKKCKKKKK